MRQLLLPLLALLAGIFLCGDAKNQVESKKLAAGICADVQLVDSQHSAEESSR